MSFNDGSSDLDKLKEALSSLTAKFSSIDDMLAAFGLANLPTAQRYGILFGICVFTLTITAVMCLLIFGGSFARMAQQSQTNEATIKDASQVRQDRALLFERLLETRDRMMKENYPIPPPKPQLTTKLTTMLLNEACRSDSVADLIGEDSKKKQVSTRHIPKGYEENYKKAYLTCQDKPGGAILSGRPEARFEAYARAYAGCGMHTSTDYRRSYARLYEAMACKSLAADDKWSKHFESRPQDVVGRMVRLEALEEEHVQIVYDITCGEVFNGDKAFDPNKLWAFRSCGPFQDADELLESDVFQRQVDEAAFCIVDNVTESVVGVLLLVKDDPKNLTIQMEPPIVKPSAEESQEQLEACFLILDRLFAHGYRRVQMSVDAQDFTSKKLARSLGFTQEGFFPKNMIVKDANRDSWVYGMINTDWNKRARADLFRKLHGAKMQRADAANNVKEGELEVQQNYLKEQKQAEANAMATKKKL